MLDNINKYNIVLGSNSPRRRQLLAEMGLQFRVEAISGIDESIHPDTPVDLIAQSLATRKAEAHPLTPDELLITADTIVVIGNDVLGKPRNEAQARDMLSRLSGNVHRVITGVALTTASAQRAFSDVTEVEFATLSGSEIDYYIDHYRPFDKAGAYGIQEWIGYIGVKSINGCFYNVMGLPLPRLWAELKLIH